MLHLPHCNDLKPAPKVNQNPYKRHHPITHQKSSCKAGTCQQTIREESSSPPGLVAQH